MKPRLSKSRFQKGLQCEKALWLATHRPDLAAPVNEAKQWIFDQGTDVGRLAQGLFPGGVEITEDYRESAQALQTTQRLLADAPRPLFEPAFHFDRVFVRVDALAPTGDGRWDLYEVKSTSKVKEQHITDAAVQTYVVEGCGLQVRSTNIVHLNTGYVWEGGPYDLEKLFVAEDVTPEARAFIASVPSTVERLLRMLDEPEPEVRIGKRCSSPYDCDFADYCHGFLPSEYPITDLPRLSEGSLHSLLDAGLLSIADIPPAFPRMTLQQCTAVEAVRAGAPRVDAVALAADLSQLEWPVYHLDFETVMTALPVWPGTHSYQAVPFQYSVHVHHANGRLEHREYLHESGDDPRPRLAQRLIEDLASGGTVVHYSPYEVRILRSLQRDVPELAGELQGVVDRLYDLERVVAQYTVHPDACGHTSIKYVLPAWCPDVSYSELAIGDGQTASMAYLKAVTGQIPEDEATQIFENLREYCGLDTLAMVRLLEVLRAAVAA